MSTTYPVIEIEFKNRKPSKALVMRTLGEYLKQGGKAFTFTWGENCIDLTWHSTYNTWYGSGWIKDIGGDDIARELNEMRQEAQQFIKSHFQFVHIGG
jgi:hypothetical protein